MVYAVQVYDTCLHVYGGTFFMDFRTGGIVKGTGGGIDEQND